MTPLGTPGVVLHRDLFERLRRDGWRVREVGGTDPELLTPEGTPWRATRMPEAAYRTLEAPLLAACARLAAAGTSARRSHVLLLEGMDASGKSGLVRRLAAACPAGTVTVVRLPPLTQTGWAHLAAYRDAVRERPGLVVLDRSWYRRPMVEGVMGYCAPAEAAWALDHATVLEEELLDAGHAVAKLYLDVSRAEQAARLAVRHLLPRLEHTLTDHDLAAANCWDALDRTRRAVQAVTAAPVRWTDVPADDKRRARLTALRHTVDLLSARAGTDDGPARDDDPGRPCAGSGTERSR